MMEIRSTTEHWRTIGRLFDRLEACMIAAARLDATRSPDRVSPDHDQKLEDTCLHLITYQRLDDQLKRLDEQLDREEGRVTAERLQQELARMQQQPGALVVVAADPATKRCYRCRNWFPKALFYKHKGRPDGYAAQCRACEQVTQAEKRAKQKTAGLSLASREGMMVPRAAAEKKRCSRCRQWQDRELFSLHRRSPDGLDNYCQACRVIINAEACAKRQAKLAVVGRSALMQNMAS